MRSKMLRLGASWFGALFLAAAGFVPLSRTTAPAPVPISFPQATTVPAEPGTRFRVVPGQPVTVEIEQHYSPDGQWLAVVNKTTGSLDLVDLGHQHQIRPVFPAGSGVDSINWSPDSRHLLVVRPYYFTNSQTGGGIESTQPLEIWQVRLEEVRVISPTLLFRADEEIFEPDGSQQVVFGHWSPNSRYVVMWVGLLSASILADGLPPLVLDTETGATYPVAGASLGQDTVLDLSLDHIALANPRYQSWSPDSTKLAITAGGYRSAQVNKWLNLFDVTTGQVTTVISQTEQIPGAVAWSPSGDWIAYAAVPAAQTGQEWADLMTFDNPAIAARRIYLLDPTSGQYHHLNDVESYQDAPVWSNDSTRLYYVQRNGDTLQLMVAEVTTGVARPVSKAQQPVDLNDPLRPTVGYYGQFGREELLDAIPELPPGAAATGRIMAGFGEHLPVSDLPLWVGDEPTEKINRRTAADGTFTVTGLQPGLIRVRDSHLEFEVPVTTMTGTVDLGRLNYPLIHPPPYYGWTAAPLPDLSMLLDRGREIDFEVCHTGPDWQRPTRQVQQATVWSQRPFSERSQAWLEWWFDRPAVLYNSEDQFEQSYPDGPNLADLTADWRYLLGLWTDTGLEFEEGPAGIGLAVPHTDCPYTRQTLDDLLAHRLLEVWLLGYRAVRIQRLDKTDIRYDEAELCDPQKPTCTERPGYHFAVRVEPAPGYQIIRFPGLEDVLAVHLIDENGRDLLTLPALQPDRWPAPNAWADLPYETCFSSNTWVRPSDEALERFAKGDPRYTVPMIKTFPAWTDDFLIYPGGAAGHAQLFNLGGFWTAAGQIIQKPDGLCQQRERDVSTGHQIEVWLKYHRLLQVQYLDNQIKFVVQPEEQGFQVIDAVRPDSAELQLIFVTPAGQEITRMPGVAR